MYSVVFRRSLRLWILVLLVALAASVHADVIRITYDLDGSKFAIRNTPFGAGDGSFDVGPGELVIDYPVVGNELVDGPVQLRGYALLLQFTSGSTGLLIATDLTTVANFEGVQTFSEGAITDGVLTWTQSFPYRAQGSNTCNGGFCGFAGFVDGVPQVIDSEDPFTLAPFRFGAGGPRAGAGFVADEVQVPGNASADTFLLLSGTELNRRRIDTTPPTITLLGDSAVSVDCGSVYKDAGATVSDNFSISAAVTTGGSVDTAQPGFYVITYDVVDDAGNAATQVTRTVTVRDNCAIQEGAVEGEGAGGGEGIAEGISEGRVEGNLEGIAEGISEGISEGIIEGMGEGAAEGFVEGFVEGGGASEGSAEGILEGAGEGLLEGMTDGAVEGEGITDGEGFAEGMKDGEDDIQSADVDGDNRLSLLELLRVIQFYNSAAFHCEPGTEDNFATGPGDQMCARHDTDFIPPFWSISLSELLRAIQFYNAGGYRHCQPDGTEDGYCAEILT